MFVKSYPRPSLTVPGIRRQILFRDACGVTPNGNEDYLKIAERNAEFQLANLTNDQAGGVHPGPRTNVQEGPGDVSSRRIL